MLQCNVDYDEGVSERKQVMRITTAQFKKYEIKLVVVVLVVVGYEMRKSLLTTASGSKAPSSHVAPAIMDTTQLQSV